MPRFEGFLLTAAGAGVNAATVDLLDRNTTSPVLATTSTVASGYWSIVHATEGMFDVRITSGTDVLWVRYDTSGQMTELEVSSFKIRNPAKTFVYDILPAAITASRTLTLPLLTGTATVLVTPTVQNIAFGVGAAINAANYVLGRNADGTNLMQFNVPTGARFEFSINDVAILNLNTAEAEAMRTHYVQVEPFSMADLATCATGDGKAFVSIPAKLAGMNLVEIHGRVRGSGTTNTMDVQVHNLNLAADMLSTKLTWDSTEFDTHVAAVPAVIDAASDHVAAFDLLRVDFDALHTTPARGCLITLGFRLP